MSVRARALPWSAAARLAASVLFLLVIVAAGDITTSTSHFVERRLEKRSPLAVQSPIAGALETGTPSRIVVPGPRPTFIWPAWGESAAGVQGIGVIARSNSQRVVPIASLTKLMTAYVILHDHPLAPNATGPNITIDAWDVADWHHVVTEDGSNVQVRSGETLSEHQLLEALLLPSADNIADTLAVWDAGSIRAFVAKMNATAVELHLHHTTYADDSGLDARSRSDAVDQEQLAADLMRIPIVRAIARLRGAPFPVVGRIPNYNPALGIDGVIGLKSGFTGRAGGCLAVAAWRTISGHRVLVIVVTLGQPQALLGAAHAAESVLRQATSKLLLVRIASANAIVGTATLPRATQPVAFEAPPKPSEIVGWPRLVLRQRLVVTPAQATGQAGTTGQASTGLTSTGQAGGADVANLEILGPEGLVAAFPLAVVDSPKSLSSPAPDAGTTTAGTALASTSATGAAPVSPPSPALPS